MVSRLQLHVLYTRGIIVSKNQFRYVPLFPVSQVFLNAGLYKPSAFFIQFSLMIANLGGKPATISYQSHGKRNRQTISTNVNITNNNVWPVIDKITHEIFPILFDFKTPKWKKNNNVFAYTLRIRQKFLTYDNVDNLTSSVMYDTHKGIFLPLSIHIKFKTLNSHSINESYFRLFRLPINLFKRYYRPAFDDKAVFH